MVESGCICYVGFLNRFMLIQANKIIFYPGTAHGWHVWHGDQNPWVYHGNEVTKCAEYGSWNRADWCEACPPHPQAPHWRASPELLREQEQCAGCRDPASFDLGCHFKGGFHKESGWLHHSSITGSEGDVCTTAKTSEWFRLQLPQGFPNVLLLLVVSRRVTIFHPLTFYKLR